MQEEQGRRVKNFMCSGKGERVVEDSHSTRGDARKKKETEK